MARVDAILTFDGAYRANSIALDHNIAICDQFNCLLDDI